MAASDDRTPLRLTSVERDSSSSVLLTFDAPDDWLADHGSYVVLEHDGTLRCYSLCGTKETPWRVAVRHLEGGRFSTWAFEQAAPGDQLTARPPRGKFTHALDPDSTREYLLVAAGAGITPVYSVARAVLEGEPRAQVTLLCVNRSLERAMLLEDLERLRSRHLGRLQLWHALTRERSALDLLSGRPDLERLHELRRRGLLPERPDEVFVSAPKELMDVVRDFATECGVAPEALHRESFGAQRSPDAAPKDEEGTHEVQARLHGSTTTIALRSGETVLEAVERARPEVPSSCRAGVCSTCIARLVEGDVEIATDHALSPQEKAADLVLTCQARPRSARVVVDYDV